VESRLGGGELYKYQEMWRGEEMKYVVIWKFKELTEDVMEASRKLTELREKEPDKLPKILFPNHTILDTTPNTSLKGFAVVEVENVKQIANWIKGSLDKWSVKYIPIMDTNEMSKHFGWT
jgi:hypothetical protein